MPDVQWFRSEAYKNGQRYLFEARFDATLWTATIRDESGQLRGAISCESLDPALLGDEREDAVCEWVHRAVQNNVGFSEDHPLAALGPLSGWMLASALHVELDRTRTVRAELALTMVKFTEVYAAYREQLAETIHRRG